MKKLLIIMAMLVLPLLSAACQAEQAAPQPATEEPAITDPAASEPRVTEPTTDEPTEATSEGSETVFGAISTKDIYGQEVDGGIFADYELTMLNIWATYCGPCIEEMPDLGEMSAEMPEGTQIVGVVSDALSDEYIELAKTIVAETGADFMHLLPDERLFAYIYHYVVGVPTTVFIDSEGNLVGEQIVGARPRHDYEAELASRLEQLRDKTPNDTNL